MSSHDAIESLKAAVAISPQNVPLRVSLGNLLLGSGQPEAAEAEFRAALAIAPDSGLTAPHHS